MIALLQRDLILAVRAGGGFGLGMAFFLIVVILVPLGIGPDMEILSKVSVGILWVGALLACVLSLDRIFSLDYDDGTLELLLTSPIPLEAVVTVKSFSHWITTGLPLVVISPILGLLLGLQVSDLKWVFISLLLGTPALSVIGAFGAALTVGIRRGGLLLSLLVLPLYVPTLIFGANVASKGLADISNNSALLILTAVTLAAFSILPFASALVLRINLR
ncbi:MAG: heme exporter protein CcmB [Paracoccaceae bacterium]